jgi:2-methylcitrate dehydratase PrpD
VNKPVEGSVVGRGRQIAVYATGALGRELPAEVKQAAITALVDFMGVAVGGYNARIFVGPLTTPALAALVNGTAAHAMDYDDAHQMGAGHISCPCWSTALAVGGHLDAGEKETLAAFIAGFEVMARLGGGGPAGVGRSLHRRGFHPTSVFGRVAAAVVASVLMRLDEATTERAVGVAATTAGGLIGSFGTHAKPFHGGKAAMDGILAAQLAAEGFESATHLLELEKGLLDSFIQDRVVEVPPMDFDARWELLRNGFKPYASCRATHASIQAARKLAPQVKGKKIGRVHAKIHPNAVITAGKLNPRSPLEGKFSTQFCIALGLSGYRLVASEFNEAALKDQAVTALLPLIELEVVKDQPQYEAHLEVTLAGGEKLRADTDIVLGHAQNPMSDGDFHDKFTGLTEPVLGAQKSERLYKALNDFEQPGTLRQIMRLLDAAA